VTNQSASRQGTVDELMNDGAMLPSRGWSLQTEDPLGSNDEISSGNGSKYWR
jgi:hypothetical protein